MALLIDGIGFEAIPADKTIDSNRIIAEMNDRGAAICISQRPRRKVPLQIGPELYGKRCLNENSFSKINEFRRIGLRAEKSDTSFTAMIYAAAALITSQFTSTNPGRRRRLSGLRSGCQRQEA